MTWLSEVEMLTTETIPVCRDPKDTMILEWAASGKANVIVTGDGDVLDLNPFQGIAILSRS